MKENEPPIAGPDGEQPGMDPRRMWYTHKEMAAKLRMHPNTLMYHRDLIHIGHSKIGRKTWYSEHDYQTFLIRFYRGPLILLFLVLSWLSDSLEVVAVF